MAISDTDLEGFEVAAERKPEKAGGVTISQIPAGLVSLLTTHAPKALADKDYELVLRMPVKAPEVKPLTDDERKDAKVVEAHGKAVEARVAGEKAATETVKQLALYATAWGKGQEPKLRITKIPNRKDMPDWHARLSVAKDADVSVDNRPGRRAN
jgi:hypothetical protein